MTKGLQAIWQIHEAIVFRGIACEDLLRRFLSQRDDQAFRELLRRHGKCIYLQCRAVLRCEDLAHEAFQATFTTLVLKGHTIKHHASIAGWLVKTARHKAISIKRSLDTRKKLEQAIGTEIAARMQGKHEPDLIQRAEAFAALAELPEKYRSALTLCVVHGATHAEAARELRWPLGTVDTRVRKGLELLKKKLERRGWSAIGATLPAILATTVEAVPPGVASAAIEAAMKTIQVHAGWKVMAVGMSGVLMGYWKWFAALLVLLGLGLGMMMYVNRPTAEHIFIATLPVSNVKLLRHQIHQQNLQVFRETVIPKVVAALQKLKLWNQPVKIVDISEKDFYLIVQVEQQAKSAGSTKPWLTTRTGWHYNLLTGAVYINLDLQGNNDWRATSVETPIRYDNPITGKPVYLSIPELLEAKKAFELLTPEPFEFEPGCVKNDPVLQSLRPFLGRWYSDSDARHPSVIFITEEGLPRSIESDGRIYALQRMPDQKRWFLENFGILSLSEDKQVLSSDLGCRWRR